jgi:hypothetical protein
MIGGVVTLAIGCAVLIAVGFWHGARMYQLGLQAGRQREALEARHAKEKLVEGIRRDVSLAAMCSLQDTDLIHRWVKEAWRRAP